MKRLLTVLLGGLVLGSNLITMPAMAAPRRPIVIRNEINSDASFKQFATKLNQAIRDRDAKYVASVLPKNQLPLGFGRPIKIADLQLNNPDSFFWGILEYTMANGCAKSLLPNSQVWLCSTISDDFQRRYPAPPNSQGVEHLVNQVVVLGQNVNVRSRPSLNGQVIGQLSNEVVMRNLKAEGVFDRNPLIGWTPVILPNGKTGFVNNRYAYFPLGYTLQVEKVNNQWRINHVLAGD
jgi:hypothetical protein